MSISHQSIICTFLFLLSTSFLSGQANLNRANKQFELSDFKEASKLYHKVIQNDPTNVEALTKLGDCYFYFNQLTTAKEFYDKASQQKGFRFECMLNYGKTLMGLGDYDEARKWFLLYGEGFPIIGEHYAAACTIASQRANEPSTYQVNSLSINTNKSDFAPAFFGDVLVYASFGKKRANESNGDRDKNQLLLSATDKDGVELSPSFLFQNKISNLYNVGPISFSENGKWVAFTRNNFVNGIRQIPSSGHELSLYIAEVKDDGQWTNILAFPYNGSGYSTAYPSLSPDGQTLYFASDRPDGLGGFDIYVSKKTGTEWSFPLNLGAPVNSPGDEITPFFTGETLYFSSNWHQGFGGFDVFRAENIGGNWSKIYHQGTGINSSRDDYGFIFDKTVNTGYLTSNRVGGKGAEDIYKVSQQAEKFLITTVDASNKPIQNVELDFSSCGQKIINTNENGQYGFQVSGNFDCEIVVRKSGYSTISKRIIATGKNGITPLEIRLESTENKETFVGRTIEGNSTAPLSGVIIIAKKLSNGQIERISSDVQGYYNLVLDLNQSYNITYSKAGYSELERLVFTGQGTDKSILDVTNMFPVNINIPDPKDTDISDTTPPVVKNDNDTETTTTTTDPLSPKPTTTTKGFSVQIAAIPMSANFSLDKYKKAKSVGNLYDKTSDTYRRIRVGIFNTKAEANAAQKRLTSLGYEKCYVVNETMQDGTVITTKPPVDVPSTNPTVKSGNDYFVRLGAFSNPENFNSKGLDIYGEITSYKSGNFTIMLIKSGTKIGRARVIRQKAEEKGFKGAYIVLEQNGTYIKKN